MTQRRFPPPWSVEEQEACFVVRDYDGQALACVYFEDEPGRRSAAKLLEWDEAAEGLRLTRSRLERTESYLSASLLLTLPVDAEA